MHDQSTSNSQTPLAFKNNSEEQLAIYKCTISPLCYSDDRKATNVVHNCQINILLEEAESKDQNDWASILASHL